MTTAKHTSGPWKAEAQPGFTFIRGPRGEFIATIASVSWDDAVLIAAAPDMLEVLEFINEWFRTAHVDTIHGSTLCGDGDDETTLAEAIKQAVAKARGEQQE